MKTILVLHGWPGYRLNDYFLTTHLKDKGYKVFCPNLFDKNNKFTIPGLIQLINNDLKGQKPLAIVGISLGGLIVPHVVYQYPNSKLIFIATSSDMKSSSKIFSMAISVFESPLGKLLSKYLLKLPSKYLYMLYKLINPFYGPESDREGYERDSKANIELIKSIPITKEIEIVNFRKQVDNRSLLKKLKNKTLIFSGERDTMMPKEKGEELHKLLVNSQLIVNKGEHFNVFGQKDLKTVEEFLRT